MFKLDLRHRLALVISTGVISWVKMPIIRVRMKTMLQEKIVMICSILHLANTNLS